MNRLIAKWITGCRNLRWYHYVLAVLTVVTALAALLALFYVEEDWRGKRAWEQFKGPWEARGERFDWASVIPPPVPDDQNFALAPIVFSTYGAYIHTNGRVIWYGDYASPSDTNVINRLRIGVPHEQEHGFLDPSHPATNFGKWEIAKRTDLNGWQALFRTPHAQRGPLARQPPPPTNEFPIAPQPQTPGADVLFALSRYDAAIAELRQASRLPRSRFPLNYEHPEDLLFAHPGSLKQCAFVLQLRSVAELSLNRTEEALEDIKLALRLAEAMRPEPFFNSQTARIIIIGSTLQPVWEGLAAHRWSDSQLVALESELSGLDFFSDYATAVRGERAMASSQIDLLRKTHNASMAPNPWEEGDNGEQSLGQLLILFYVHSFPSGWYYQNQFRACRAYTEELLPLLDPKTRTVSQVLITNLIYNGRLISSRTDMTDRLDSPNTVEWGNPFWHPFSILESLVFRRASAGQFAYAQGSVDLARVACALDRYRLWQGDYPESLGALAPRFLATLPHDLINGQPLRYRLTANRQFVLYSVGWANQDDGGKVRYPHDQFEDVRNGNWVWRYP